MCKDKMKWKIEGRRRKRRPSISARLGKSKGKTARAKAKLVKISHDLS